jgi:hypothetical protein
MPFAPAVGVSGDDKYNIPGGVKLDGSQDAGNPSSIISGDASGFSTIPLISELTASSGLNQIIGLINRRILTWNAAFGTSIVPLAYLTPPVRLRAADVTAIFNKINELRTLENFASYTFPTSQVQSGLPIRGTHIAHMRKALAIPSGLYSLKIAGNPGYVRIDSPYGVLQSEALGMNQYMVVGQMSTDLSRRRRLSNFCVPSWLNDVSLFSSPSFQKTWFSRVGTVTLNLYCSNTDDQPPNLAPPGGGTPYHTDNLEGTIVAGASSLAVSAARIAAAAGHCISYLVAAAQDVAGTNVNGYVNGGDGSSNAFSTGLYLTIN